MENLMTLLVQERMTEARRKADETRRVRSARRSSAKRSLVDRVRGDH